MSEKKCLVILISYLKRVGSRTETTSSLQQYEYQMSQKASGKQGIPGELLGKQASAEGLQMGRQEKPFAEHHRGMQQTALTIALRTHVVEYQVDTIVLVSLHLLRQAD